jgi:ABC-type glycerol-3-phosphate transport system permease component
MRVRVESSMRDLAESFGWAAARALVVSAPCVLIFFLAQRHIIDGISFTGDK